MSFQTSGLGSGREVSVYGSIYSNEPGTDPKPVYLFTKGQRHISFTATGTSSASVNSVKLTGTLKTTCAAKRVNQYDSEQHYETSVPLGSVNAPPQSQSSLSTSLVVDFLSYFEEYRCPTGFLPWKQEASLYAETTGNTGIKAYSQRKSFIFMQSFKVATYNVQNAKLELGGDTVNSLAVHMNHENDVDAVVLQEANPTTVSRLRQNTNLGLLKTSVYEAGSNLQNGSSTAIFSKFPVIAHESIQHSRAISGMDHRWHYATLDLGGFPLKLANVHFISDSVAEHRGLNAPDHRYSNAQDVIDRMGLPETAAIIAGDFNTPVHAAGSNYSTYNAQLAPITYSPLYRHFCVANSCEGSLNPESRYNIDQIWVTLRTSQGLRVVDGYLARPPLSRSHRTTRCRSAAWSWRRPRSTPVAAALFVLEEGARWRCPEKPPPDTARGPSSLPDLQGVPNSVSAPRAH
ncbi:endonuclease/exonuclease/phosphatase family protein [Stigmatella sp. ncwal1]|uniref:Endonuclease/exonuclease/phosphatase family protein n=1 Tax=Stigmatella ashevillensis TaxID=2995309 RepID=A0ABT5D9L0_9BACT|nr:endonuclease/exonuclease/phosphatase family protein [Stigmatella ashevillena]MDC0709488.1 endonuclease/exonuclease/phosphatase family protein [Stigmatella ashevillena]